jgi:hypothetical protein
VARRPDRADDLTIIFHYFCAPSNRRHYVAFSECRTEVFTKEFWDDFWSWYTNGDGFKHIAALLHHYDLSNFNPAAPRKTPAFWHMVEADRGEEQGELADAIEALGNPDALTINQLTEKAPGLEWPRDLKKRRTDGCS